MKKHILFLNCTLGLGGVERSLCDVLRNIDFQKYSVDLYLDSTTGGLTEQLPVQIHLITPNMDDCYGRFSQIFKELVIKKDWARIYLRIIKKMTCILGPNVYSLLKPLFSKKDPYDIVIAYREGDITQFAYRAFRWKKFISWWHYGEVPADNHEYYNLKKLSHLVAVSEKSHNLLSNTFPYISDKIVTIPNMVDVLHIHYLSKSSQPLYSKDLVHIVTIARLSPEKHLENTIYCTRQLIAHNIPVQWHIIGGGLQYTELLTKIQDNHLEDYVILEGEKNNPYPYVLQADLYVHTSYVESQGLTILEAMALGVPCVVTRSLGPCEFIEDGVNGILTEQNPQSLSEKVMDMLTDRALYDKIKANTHCPVQFSPKQVMAQIEELLEE